VTASTPAPLAPDLEGGQLLITAKTQRWTPEELLRARPVGRHRNPNAVPVRRRSLRTRSLGIASHWPFEQWGRFLPGHTTAVSLLDRLLHHNNVVATDGESYRMREARKRSGGRPSKT